MIFLFCLAQTVVKYLIAMELYAQLIWNVNMISRCWRISWYLATSKYRVKKSTDGRFLTWVAGRCTQHPEAHSKNRYWEGDRMWVRQKVWHKSLTQTNACKNNIWSVCAIKHPTGPVYTLYIWSSFPNSVDIRVSGSVTYTSIVCFTIL